MQSACSKCAVLLVFLIFGGWAFSGCGETEAPGLSEAHQPVLQPDTPETRARIRKEFTELPRPIIAKYRWHMPDISDPWDREFGPWYEVVLTDKANAWVKAYPAKNLHISLWPMLDDETFSGDAFAVFAVLERGGLEKPSERGNLAIGSRGTVLHSVGYWSPTRPGKWEKVRAEMVNRLDLNGRRKEWESQPPVPLEGEDRAAVSEVLKEFQALPRPLVWRFTGFFVWNTDIFRPDEYGKPHKYYTAKVVLNAGAIHFVESHSRTLLVRVLAGLIDDSKWSGDACLVLSVILDRPDVAQEIMGTAVYISPEKPGDWAKERYASARLRLQRAVVAPPATRPSAE